MLAEQTTEPTRPAQARYVEIHSPVPPRQHNKKHRYSRRVPSFEAISCGPVSWCVPPPLFLTVYVHGCAHLACLPAGLSVRGRGRGRVTNSQPKFGRAQCCDTRANNLRIGLIMMKLSFPPVWRNPSSSVPTGSLQGSIPGVLLRMRVEPINRLHLGKRFSCLENKRFKSPVSASSLMRLVLESCSLVFPTTAALRPPAG